MYTSHTQEDCLYKWQKVLATPEGQGLMADVLDDLGLGKPLDATAESVALYNFGQNLLHNMFKAAPHTAAAIVGHLHAPKEPEETHGQSA